MMRLVSAIAAALALSGCVTTETAQFSPSVGQEAIVRDGNPALVSKKPSSIVLVRPELVREEQSRQVMAAILVGVAAGANAAAANNAGYYNSRSTIYTPRGTATVYTSGYSPAAAQIARNNAAYENAAMTAAVIERGQQNLAGLEQQVLKANTIMPGEWVGGQVHISPPAKTESGKEYRITVVVGADVHQIDVSQRTAGS